MRGAGQSTCSQWSTGSSCHCGHIPGPLCSDPAPHPARSPGHFALSLPNGGSSPRPVPPSQPRWKRGAPVPCLSCLRVVRGNFLRVGALDEGQVNGAQGPPLGVSALPGPTLDCCPRCVVGRAREPGGQRTVDNPGRLLSTRCHAAGRFHRRTAGGHGEAAGTSGRVSPAHPSLHGHEAAPGLRPEDTAGKLAGGAKGAWRAVGRAPRSS